MHKRFDQIGKKILRGALEPAGTVAIELEVPTADAQAIDTWFEPDPARHAELARAGLLGRMASGPSLFEPFRNTPGVDDLRGCFRKQYTQDHGRVLEAKKLERPRPPFPQLWALSTGRPESVLRRYGLSPVPGWPAGVYLGHEADARGVVVLRELPQGRETLLLRLMGAGAVLAEAVAELGRLPDDAWERQLAIPPLIAERKEIPQDSRDEEERGYLMSTQSLYEEWERKVAQTGREQGREEGREQGTKRALGVLYEARFGAMPLALAEAIENVHDVATLERWLVLVGTRSQDEVAAAVQAQSAAAS
jgi:hypothetical protein